MCWLSFNNANNQIDRKLNEQEFDKFNSLVNDKNFIFFEPALTIRGGWKYVKV
jgi:hypothetical protein